jgi:TonB family protein
MVSSIWVMMAILPMSVSWPYSSPRQSEEPVVKRAIPAIYPPLASVAEQSGTVVVEVKVNPGGTVSEATAIDGHRLFRTTAQRSARQWVFNPVGEQTSRVTRLTFSFRFIKKPKDPEDLLPAFIPPYGVEIRTTTAQYVFHKNVDPPNRMVKRKPATKHP